jgi:hypothetical protein
VSLIETGQPVLFGIDGNGANGAIDGKTFDGDAALVAAKAPSGGQD